MSDSLMYQAAKEKEYSMHWMPLRCLAYFFKCKFAIYHKNQSVEGQEFGIKIEGNPSMKYRVKLEYENWAGICETKLISDLLWCGICQSN